MGVESDVCAVVRSMAVATVGVHDLTVAGFRACHNNRQCRIDRTHCMSRYQKAFGESHLSRSVTPRSNTIWSDQLALGDKCSMPYSDDAWRSDEYVLECYAARLIRLRATGVATGSIRGR